MFKFGYVWFYLSILEQRNNGLFGTKFIGLTFIFLWVFYYYLVFINFIGDFMTLNAKIINLPSLGFSGSISEACRKFNVPLHVFCSRRYHHKWDIEKCFSTPVRKKTCFKTNMKPKNICIHFKDDEEYKCLPELMQQSESCASASSGLT